MLNGVSLAATLPTASHYGISLTHPSIASSTETVAKALITISEVPYNTEFEIQGKHQRRAATLGVTQKTPQVQTPAKVQTKPNAQPMISDRVALVLARLLPLLERQARINHIAVSKVNISGFMDPDEGSQEIVISQWVRTSPSVALNYWDKLGVALEIWSEYLPEVLKMIVLERIAIEVKWTQHDTGI